MGGRLEGRRWLCGCGCARVCVSLDYLLCMCICSCMMYSMYIARVSIVRKRQRGINEYF